jgi:hypothetical protein
MMDRFKIGNKKVKENKKMSDEDKNKIIGKLYI